MTNEYIKREDVKNYPIRLNHYDKKNGNLDFVLGIESVLEYADDIPAADVVEVVRCKDCEYCCFTIDPKTNIGFQKCGYVGYNPVQSSQVSDNDFCSHGERRVEE